MSPGLPPRSLPTTAQILRGSSALSLRSQIGRESPEVIDFLTAIVRGGKAEAVRRLDKLQQEGVHAVTQAKPDSDETSPES